MSIGTPAVPAGGRRVSPIAWYREMAAGQRRTFWACYGGHALDAMDTQLYSWVLPALLSQCDVLVFPSYFEGLAQVQLEALAAGLPIIATDASGATDLIADSREGYIIPVGDAEALREAMLNFINSPADLAVMSPAARSCAERYSWEAYGDRWIDLLDQVVHPNSEVEQPAR